jgi:hypothetical protein
MRLLFSIFLISLAMPAAAAIELYKKDGLQVDATFEAGFGGFHTLNTNFGNGLNGNDQVSWQEYFIKPGLLASYATNGQGGKVYGGFNVVGSMTRGDGDAALDYGTNKSFTPNEPENLEVDEAYVGYNTGKIFGQTDIVQQGAVFINWGMAF